MGGGDTNTALAGTRFRVDWVEQTGSTNDDLVVSAKVGAPDGTVLVADHQTSGHGRRGRSWTAPPGSSLLFSILLRPDLEPDQLHLLTTALGVVTVETLREEYAVDAGLKWPNDVLARCPDGAEQRKLGGILAEAVWSGDRLEAVVIGMGLNVQWPHLVPVELDGVATALNHLIDEPVDRERLLVSILKRLDPVLDDPMGADLIARWEAVAFTLDQEVRVELASGEVVEGTASGITAEGRLVVETPDGRREITAGDVHHLRPTT